MSMQSAALGSATQHAMQNSAKSGFVDCLKTRLSLPIFGMQREAIDIKINIKQIILSTVKIR